MERREINLSKEYDNILLDLIPHLKEYKVSSGGEGKVYFVNNNYVVKQYTKKEHWDMFDEVFDVYCKEMQDFAEKGYNVPKIYSWIKVPNVYHYSKDQKLPKYNYYILEERIQGRYLFFGSLEEFYPMCRNLMSREYYKLIVGNPHQHIAECSDILKKYMNDFVEMNELLTSMSEQKLANFLVSAYQMHMKSEYSEPDLYPSNVLVNGEEINMIDSYIYTRGGSRTSSDDLTDKFLSNLINLFLYNEQILTLDRGDFKRFYGISDSSEYLKIKNENKKLLRVALERIFKMLKKYCEIPRITNYENYMLALSLLRNFFDDEEEPHKIIDCLGNFE